MLICRGLPLKTSIYSSPTSPYSIQMATTSPIHLLALIVLLLLNYSNAVVPSPTTRGPESGQFTTGDCLESWTH
ncbi:hypothetical protein BD311DRAFT_379135 [Dichomitus squalens]|uniref:Uncharacterized protein n=1 Tax=Dichomitus squalens TaxID=114155 RepID=A0A4Q9MIS2_9APHY|nr:hypothetical protein BD311DRAFT_379135 [Dichomitus squalens]